MAEFEVLMARIVTHLDTFHARINKLISLANEEMEKAPAPVAWLIRGRLDGLSAKMTEFEDLTSRTLSNGGNPTNLRITADAWNEQVAVRVSRAWTDTQDNVMHTFAHWTGKAAFTYKALFSPHWNALTTVRQAANELNKFLHEVAALIFEFWVKVALAMITLVGAALGAVMTAAGPGPAKAAGIALAVAATGAFIKLVTDLTDQMNSKFQDLKTKRLPLDALRTQPPYSEGKWPTPDGLGYATIDNPDNWSLR